MIFLSSMSDIEYENVFLIVEFTLLDSLETKVFCPVG